MVDARFSPSRRCLIMTESFRNPGKFKSLLLIIMTAVALAGCGGKTGGADNSSWYEHVPPYRGTPYAEVNHDIPFFDDEEKKNTDAFEKYSELDRYGRCGVAYANVCLEIMPTDDRESSLNSVTPSGWVQNQYDGEYLLNRCHLIGYQLAGENSNEKNLIAGTRYFNVEGMLPFENTVADYIYDHPLGHVLYRVTPVYDSPRDLMACGVLMEAWSVEDNGYGCQFCVFVYNVQPGVKIDYATGENEAADEDETANKKADATVPAKPEGSGDGDLTGSESADAKDKNAAASESASNGSSDNTAETARDYVLNTDSKKFHLPDCHNAAKISGQNREDFHGTMSELITRGYEPAKCCINP